MTTNWMIYGAYGYSGELIAREAATRGLKPVLAGRSADKVKALATELGLEARVVDLSDSKGLEAALADVELVLHCAGPFSATSAPMLEACLNTRTHYFDITGEIDVLEHAHSAAIAQRARDAGVMVCPGVGFDVVPTDCLAAKLKAALPDATELDLAFKAGGSMSPGTAKTSVEGMAGLTKVRRDGRIVETPLLTRELPMGGKQRTAMSIPWGDVSTAFVSTGIANVTVYVPVAKRTVTRIRRLQSLRWFLGMGWVQSLMKNRITKSVKGPSAEQRAKTRTDLWGEVRNAQGKAVSAHFDTPNGYDLTITAPLAIVQAVLAGDVSATGSITPSQLMGPDFVWALPGVTPLVFND
ncbi:MAG: saccharopine dehydrogenase NADP-binding domain-containing protein [Saccharospirillum sp.]|nr:saccharopine dehydrogenase NADP-binding domain-containing protein [Saccharospirillum sp.]